MKTTKMNYKNIFVKKNLTKSNFDGFFNSLQVIVPKGMRFAYASGDAYHQIKRDFPFQILLQVQNSLILPKWGV